MKIEQEILGRYLEVIYLRCVRILRDKELARDALQDIFAAFYERLSKEVIEKPLHYLYRSSTNHCLNLLQRHRRMLRFESHLHESLVQPLAESGILVDELLQAFGEDALQLMVYRYVDQMTYEEIGEVFSCSDRAVKKRLDRLQAKAKEFIKLA